MPTEDIPTETLRRNLARLHAELRAADTLDPETREMLETVAQDIERSLEGEHDPDSVGGRVEQIEKVALRFEASHPILSRLLSELTDTLTKIGL
ncbi:MAG TPA: DUF4404 family protein [Gammaproteobacteria bacterium]|nr:DUF4404 family protein [Gammaproteobacteria bacterium]